jgi:hypothetical protein
LFLIFSPTTLVARAVNIFIAKEKRLPCDSFRTPPFTLLISSLRGNKKITKMVKKFNRYLFALEQKTLLFCGTRDKIVVTKTISGACVWKKYRGRCQNVDGIEAEKENAAVAARLATCNKNVNCRILFDISGDKFALTFDQLDFHNGSCFICF